MILHPGEERVSLYPAKRQAPVAQWIEHLITVQKVGGSSPSGRAAAPLGAIHRWGFCISTKHSFGSAYFMPSARGDPIRVTQGRCVLSWPRWCIAGEPSQGRGPGWRLKEKPPPLHETWGVMKLSSPQQAQNLLYLPFFDEQGRFFFHAACESTFSCSAGAVFLSLRSLDASCCERGSASARTLRHLGETDDIFAGGVGGEVTAVTPLRARNALETAESSER